jgi:hypothetical protein
MDIKIVRYIVMLLVIVMLVIVMLIVIVSLMLLMRILLVLVLVPFLPLMMLLLVIKEDRVWLCIRAPHSFSDMSNGVFIPIASRALPIHVKSKVDETT